MYLSLFLGSVAVVITLATFLFYNRDVLKGDVGPTMPSWLLWTVITLINTATFKFVSESWLTTSAILVDCIGGFITTALIFYKAMRQGASLDDFFKGLWKNMNVWQRTAATLSFLAILVWIFFRSAPLANVVVLVGYAAAFGPTYGTVLADPKKEKPRQWIAWAFAHSLIVSVVMLDPEAKRLELVTPVVYTLLHIGVGVLACRDSQENETT